MERLQTQVAACLTRAVALLAAALACGPLLAAERIGFRDDGSSADGWRDGVWPGTTGLHSITSDGQQLTFTTLNGSYMVGASAAWAPNWPDWDPKVAEGLAMIVRKYPVTVDLDRYPYLVVRMPYSGTYMALAVNGWDTKVCYTTGLHAVDLRDIPQPSLRGQQPIEIRLTFLNTEESVVLDDVRLVSELTAEERAGFIPAGLDLRLPKLDPLPYHGLEVLNARAGAPARFDLPTEGAVFRDTSTGAEVWRLTRSVRFEFCDNFSPDGSALPVYNRSQRWTVLYDFDRGGLQELVDVRGAPTFSRDDASVAYLLQSTDSPTGRRFVVQAVSIRSGQTRTVADWPSTDEGFSEFGRSAFSDRLILGLKEGRALFLIDPQASQPEARVRRVPLPMRMKAAYLSHDDARVNWQRCYYFQRWQMDLSSGRVVRGAYPTYGGHEIVGHDQLIGRYGSLLLAHRLGILPLDESRADEVRIWSNWTTPVPSDYGQLAADDRWLVTNGTEGAVAGKRLLIDGNETGTVLQIVHDFTSRNSWDSNTYSRISPDATKLAYNSDMLGDTDVYVAVTRRPQAPRDLVLSREGGQVRLRWTPPAAAREVRGYNVYRRSLASGPYQRLNRDRVPGPEFTDPAPPAAAGYAVAAEEHSGLEGLYSNEVRVGRPGPASLRAEIEEARLVPPLRQAFDGAAVNYRCARVWAESPAEEVGQAEVDIDVTEPGTYGLWLRVRGSGTVEARLGQGQSVVTVDSPDWAWVRAAGALALPPGRQTLTLTSRTDGLCLDRLLLTTDPQETPSAPDDRDPTPTPVQGLHATEVSPDQVRLAWTATPDLDLSHYSVYVGAADDLQPGNASLLVSGPATEALDWGFAPGCSLVYKVVAVNKRGLASAPATVRVQVPVRETATVELPIAQAVLSGGLELAIARGVTYAWLPRPLAADAARPRASWSFALPHPGTWYLWATYTTVDAKSVALLWFETDGEQRLNGQNWRLRLPCTLTRHQGGIAPGEETWFSDKVMAGWWAGPFDHVALAAGTHTLSVAFDPAHAPSGPRLATVYLSSDPAYRPPGFDPRVDFRK